MNNWLNLPKQRQVDLFNQLSAMTGIQPQAIEKDAWVTLVLRMIFHMEMQENMIYGESLDFDKLIELIKYEHPAGNNV
jgi:hypothetical protein